MASLQVNFTEQLRETRKKIQDSFKRSHESLRVRENVLLSRVEEIETEYKDKIEEINGLLETLNKLKSYNSDALTSNVLSEAREGVNTVIDGQVAKLAKELHCSIEFEWDPTWETRTTVLGHIKLNSLPPLTHSQLKPVVTKTLQPPVQPVPNLFGKPIVGQNFCPQDPNIGIRAKSVPLSSSFSFFNTVPASDNPFKESTSSFNFNPKTGNQFAPTFPATAAPFSFGQFQPKDLSSPATVAPFSSGQLSRPNDPTSPATVAPFSFGQFQPKDLSSPATVAPFSSGQLSRPNDPTSPATVAPFSFGQFQPKDPTSLATVAPFSSGQFQPKDPTSPATVVPFRPRQFQPNDPTSPATAAPFRFRFGPKNPTSPQTK